MSEQDAAYADLGDLKPFHWQLEFPEVFLGEGRQGFDAFVGNPPFLGGRYISGQMGNDYLSYLKSTIAFGTKGNSDLVAYFYLRTNSLLLQNGTTGFIGTKTITEGDTYEVGLAQIEQHEADFFRATTSQKWPGTASVLYVSLHWCKGGWKGKRTLDENEISYIGAKLTGIPTREPKQLSQIINPYQGCYVHGMGFFLTPLEREKIIKADPKSTEAIFSCITASDFNNSPSQESDRFVIYFAELPEDEASEFQGVWNYIIKNVKPQRQKVKDKNLSKYWWRFKRPTKPLYDAIWQQSRTLVCPVVTKYLSFVWIYQKTILLNKMYAFIGAERDENFSILQNSIYEVWVRYWSGSLGETLQYAPTDCFYNYPFPNLQSPNLSTPSVKPTTNIAAN